jgi:hypothetical protein
VAHHGVKHVDRILPLVRRQRSLPHRLPIRTRRGLIQGGLDLLGLDKQLGYLVVR